MVTADLSRFPLLFCIENMYLIALRDSDIPNPLKIIHLCSLVIKGE